MKVNFFILAIVTSFTISCMDSFLDEPREFRNNNDPVDAPFFVVDSISSGYVDTLRVKLQNGLTMLKIDSLYYWDDMVFSERGLDYFYTKDRTAFRDEAQFYWPHGIVYYKYNINVPYSERHFYQTAMSHIMNKTSLLFLAANSNTQNYIEFYKSTTRNYSRIGMQAGGQRIEIAVALSSIIEHEIMHALGFLHEHCRQDRDDYIIVDSTNVVPNKWYNFQKYIYNNSISGMELGPFDFNSIMLYDSYSNDPDFVIDPDVPIITDLNGNTFESSDSLSVYDVIGIESIYGPPFHRLEHSRLNIIVDTTNGFSEQLITEDSDSLVFYADKNCTIRQPLLYPRKIKLKKTVYYNEGVFIQNAITYEQVTIPAGTSSYHIWTGYNYECYYCSDPTNYYITHYSVVNEHLNEAYNNY